MDRVSTLFLRIVVVIIALPVLIFCGYALPRILGDAVSYFPPGWVYPVVICIYGASISYFFALFQTFKLLNYIDRNAAFSDASVLALRRIKYCAVWISALFGVSAPFLYLMAEMDDAPGLLAMGLIVAFASTVIAVFAAVLQKLLRNAIDIKSENDLTV